LESEWWDARRDCGAGCRRVIIGSDHGSEGKQWTTLLDVAQRLAEQIASAVDQTEGCYKTERVRVRRAGQRYFVDSHQLAAHLELEQDMRQRRNREADRANRFRPTS